MSLCSMRRTGSSPLQARREGERPWPALTSSISRIPTAATMPPLESFALKPVTMTWRQGGAYALLGPSGCGKTTLLNMISGIVDAVARQDPVRRRRRHAAVDRERNIAQVFQFPVIYDTMTVGQNLAFPLKNRGVPKARDRQARRRDRAICSISRRISTARPRGSPPTPSRRFRSGAASSVPTSPRCCSTSR